MKKQILMAAFLGIITIFSYTSANAQTNSSITADIGFDFYVGGKKMTAGKYVIEKLNPAHDKTALLLRRRDDTARVIMMPLTITVAKKDDETLLFNRYGDVYYLSMIRNRSAGIEMRLRQHKTEIEFARQFRQSKGETVSLKLPRKQKTEPAALSD